MNYYDFVLKNCFGYLIMAVNVFGNGSKSFENRIDTSLFVQKLRSS